MTYKPRSSHLRIRRGIYHFNRRIPSDLQSYYRSDRVCLSLHTTSQSTAYRLAQSIAQQLDDYWAGLRLQRMELPGLHLLISGNEKTNDDSPRLDKAVEAYLLLKGSSDNTTFARTARRSVPYAIEKLGNRSITAYSSADAAKFRDHLFE